MKKTSNCFRDSDWEPHDEWPAGSGTVPVSWSHMIGSLARATNVVEADDVRTSRNRIGTVATTALVRLRYKGVDRGLRTRRDETPIGVVMEFTCLVNEASATASRAARDAVGEHDDSLADVPSCRHVVKRGSTF